MHSLCRPGDLEPTQKWEERADSTKLSSDWHTRAVAEIPA